MRLYICLLLAFIVFIINLAYQFSIFNMLEFDDAFKWIKNNLGCTLFASIFLPIAVGIFTYCFPLNLYDDNFKLVKIILSTIFIPTFILSSSRMVIKDITTSRHRILLPYHLRNYFYSLELEKRLRSNVEERNISSENARNTYKNSVENFSSIHKLFELGSTAVKLELIINFIGAYFCVIYATVVGLFIIGKNFNQLQNSQTFTLQGFIAIYFILIFWFILRLYSEWYINFYSFQFITQYSVYIRNVECRYKTLHI
jgi:hypothetical protein